MPLKSVMLPNIPLIAPWHVGPKNILLFWKINETILLYISIPKLDLSTPSTDILQKHNCCIQIFPTLNVHHILSWRRKNFWHSNWKQKWLHFAVIPHQTICIMSDSNCRLGLTHRSGSLSYEKLHFIDLTPSMGRLNTGRDMGFTWYPNSF